MGEKKKQASAYREPLILIAFVILGAIIGMVMGEKASFLYPIGQIWLNLLFVLLVPLLFFSISSSIANISDTKSVGKLLGFTLVIFVVTAAIAGSFMFVVLGIFGVDTSVQLGAGDATAQAAASSIGDQIVNTFTVGDFPDVISRGHILALIVFTVFFGVTVSSLGEKGREIANWLNNMSLVFYKMVAILMKAAPLGLMAYFANLTGTYGSDLLKSYGRGLLIYYPTVFVYFFVFLGLYAFIAAVPMGFYVLGAYRVFKSDAFGEFEPVFRFSYIDTDGRGIRGRDVVFKMSSAGLYDRVSAYYAGVNWYLNGKYLKFSLGWERYIFEDSPTGGYRPQAVSDTAIAQIQVVF